MANTGRSEFAAALNQVAHERGLDPFEVLDTIKAAILAAYRRDYDAEMTDEVEAQVDAETGEVKLIKEDKDITPPGFGRIAAQTAKQVLLQRIREAEKTAILVDYSKKVGTVVSGMIQRAQGLAFIVDIGRAEAVLPPREQARMEHYYLNQRLKFYILEIRDRDKRSEIIVSRTSPELVIGLFKNEVPEINAGSVEIKAIAREAGFRTKIAVASNQTGVDPVGSCVGQRGNRIQTVINELNGEKIDVIAYNEDPIKCIIAALQPAKNVRIELVKDEEGNNKALAYVPEDELSLAIGSKGQNVRLASQLSGYPIEIVSKDSKPDAAGGEEEENIFKKKVESPKVAEDTQEEKTELIAETEPESNDESPAEDSETAPGADSAGDVKSTTEAETSTEELPTESEGAEQPLEEVPALITDTQTTEDNVNALGETEGQTTVPEPELDQAVEQVGSESAKDTVEKKSKKA